MSQENKGNEVKGNPKLTYAEMLNVYKLLCKGMTYHRARDILGLNKIVDVYRALGRAGIYKKYGTVTEWRRKNNVHPTRRKYSEKRVENVEKLIREGRTLKEALKECSVNEGTWYGWKAQGLAKSCNEIKRIDDEKYRKAYRRFVADTTITRAQVAKIYGVNESTMQHRWQKMQLSTKGRPGKCCQKAVIDEDKLKKLWNMYAAGTDTEQIEKLAGIILKNLKAKWIKAGYPYEDYARIRYDKRHGKGTYDKRMERLRARA